MNDLFFDAIKEAAKAACEAYVEDKDKSSIGYATSVQSEVVETKDGRKSMMICTIGVVNAPHDDSEPRELIDRAKQIN